MNNKLTLEEFTKEDVKLKLKVLSLFDGIGGARQAIKNLGIDCQYYSYEIDKYAIKIAQANHPDIIQCGNVLNASFFGFIDTDLLIAGSPCQGFSFAGKQLNFEDPRSKLFFEFVRVKNEIKPKYFLLENVKMKKEYQDVISKELGVEPIEINSALLTAQNRKRLYWTNIPNIKQPQDQYLKLKDILEESTGSKTNCLTTVQKDNLVFACTTDNKKRVIKEQVKSNCLTASYCKGLRATSRPGIATKESIGKGFDEVTKTQFRKLTPIECERLQGFPDNYTSGVSNTQRYKALGNSFTVPVIEHILNKLKENPND